MNFTIGLSGLRTAQQSIELIGTNIANVATEGYHRQDAIISPMATDLIGTVPVGGSQISHYRRAIDSLLEDEILHQRPQYHQLSQELTTLRSLEAALGTLDSQSLTTAMNAFFGALRELAADPASQALRQQAVWAADGLAAGFRQLGEVLDSLDDQALVESRIAADQINSLAAQIAQMNNQIELIAIRGGNANLLMDQRDQRISELAERIGITTHYRTDGSETVDVLVGGTPVVLKEKSFELAVNPLPDGQLGLTAVGSISYETDISGGKLGGLFALRNDLLAEIQTDLDNLAAQIVREVNRVHVQAVGVDGSFASLTGATYTNPDATLASWSDAIEAGSLRLRLVDPTGQATVHQISIDPETDTLNTVAAALAALDPAHLSASVASGRLNLQGLDGWTFDFLPASSLSAAGPWTGTSAAGVSGLCTGESNDTFAFTVQGGGRVGLDDGVTVEVRNGAGELVTILNAGRGYAAGTALEFHPGVRVAFSTGTLTDGEQFDVDVVAESDPTGFLAEAGLATLFTGSNAREMAVRQELLSDPGRLATARGTDQADNVAVRRMAEVAETPLAALDGSTPVDFFRLTVTGIGQAISVREVRQESLENVMQQLANQRDVTSGVDINDEAAKLMVFEKMFQSMAKLLQVQTRAMDTLIELL
ncbi:MAG TPA: flagellar hook-associated protein FlgK [Phycisphaerae bacterium]|nr:flagellar hook-associated protein FlgK [Phycisphaerae bacterium]